MLVNYSQQIQSLVEAIAKQAANPPTQKEQAQAAPPFRAFDASREEWREYFAQLQAHMTVYKITGAKGVHRRHQNQLRRAGRPDSAARSLSTDLVRGGFQPRLPTSLPPPEQQQQPSPLPRRQPVPLMPPAQLHPGAPQVVAPAPAVPLQSPPPSELMDVDPSAGPPSQAVAVQPVLQPLSLGTPKESDTAAPCPAPTQQPSTQRQETLPLFVGPDAPSRPVPEAAPVVTGVHPDLGFQSVFPEAPRSQCWGKRARGLAASPLCGPDRERCVQATAEALRSAAAAHSSSRGQLPNTAEMKPSPLRLIKLTAPSPNSA
ncbi:splicing factor 3A subunit 2-like [Schistocerca serialis cubense]|uniref:splicing factor 3A subunit 2-like n=1 Tax=Schistocerca serialis cubense TaxID=2023355 RepID=UPI00214E790A|nr:splicing factor 3A subunit 2-like [Schistocerca serialis cubense]